MIQRNSVVTVFFIAMMGLSHFSHGWGQTGHRVIGKIAENHLSPKAREAVKKILGHEGLAMASTWMDDVRSDPAYDHTHDWHWVTVPDSLEYAQTEKNPNGDLILAIERMKATLKSDTASIQSRKMALRFLVHLVGDLHQPLHVGGGEDRGGNQVKVKWFYKPSNLHRVWDSDMIDGKQLSYTEIAESIDNVTKLEMDRWQQNPIASAVQEDKMMRPQVYATGDKDKMGYEYSYQNWDTVQHQLLKAGVRLAGILNELYA